MLIRLKLGDSFEAKNWGRSQKPEALKDREEAKKARQEAADYWSKRNVVFHSWRHFYGARMADKITARKVMLATGHKTEAVFQEYADHLLEADRLEVAVTTGEVFGGIIPKQIGGRV
jgi:integrase